MTTTYQAKTEVAMSGLGLLAIAIVPLGAGIIIALTLITYWRYR